MARIGVEQSLSNVKDALMEKGYNVVDLKNEEDAKNCDMAVISGQDKDVMGIADVVTENSVINAQGVSAEEVCDMVSERVQ
ncbi:YkuS family protein [Virgibacillus sp. MSJ-26]|uniref:YkuS family protein n=1 Tax=Virgibacillus sp. MSJ-26 TaxID=2841522 RepID=UPI001C101940|nr:YkuS family protein [Virgibacillus sp. MSJ-26]MBU5465753.1 YkuS family protein [Virgibacillus sp. MSJ-26]